MNKRVSVNTIRQAEHDNEEWDHEIRMREADAARLLAKQFINLPARAKVLAVQYQLALLEEPEQQLFAITRFFFVHANNLRKTLTESKSSENASGLHPETRLLLNDFIVALANKLENAESKYGYGDNWLTDDWEHKCRSDLKHHLEKGDPLDVAAYCAFMWKRGWSTVLRFDK